MTLKPFEIFLDRIRFRSDGRAWDMAPVDLHPLFERQGIGLVTPSEPRGPFLPWKDRPWRAFWEITKNRLRLVGIWGDLGDFDFSGRPPVAPWIGEAASKESRQFLEAHGYTALWHQLFPDLMPGQSVEADWCGQEICVVDSSERVCSALTEFCDFDFSSFYRDGHAQEVNSGGRRRRSVGRRGRAGL